METNFKKIHSGIKIFVGLFFVLLLTNTQAQNFQTDKAFQFFSTEKFSFEFKNDHSVKRFEDIWYVQNNVSKNTSFVLFEKKGKIFNENLFECGAFFDRTEYCYSKTGINTVIKNIVIKNRSQANQSFTRVGAKAFNFFARQDFAKEAEKGLDIVTRAEALKFVLKWRDPGGKYEQYRKKCFDDISVDHPLSGEICFAKEKGIVQGISGKFFPDLSINLWGTLKIAHKVFDIPVEPFEDWSLVEEKVFREMSTQHGATNIIANAYRDGIIRATENLSFWPNTAVNRGQFLSILYRFHRHRTDDNLKEFSSNQYKSAPSVYQEDLLVSYRASKFDEEKNIEGTQKKIEWKQIKNRLIVYEKISEGVFRYIFSLKIKSQVESVDLWWEEKKFEGVTQVITQHGTKILLKISPHQKLLEQIPSQSDKDVKQTLERNNWLPNKIQTIEKPTIPVVKIFLTPQHFSDILTFRTARERYVGWMEIVYPSGQKTKRAIRVKTRGNATIGYIKPSFTVETFKKFKSKNIDFLEGGNEFKLRSFINDESMISEKLFYQSFKYFGYPAPDFEPVLVELNGEPFGLYQLTEPIKSEFFERRNIATDNYFYAQNSGSKYNTNLKALPTDSLTLSQYKIRGNRYTLLDFIKSINDDLTDSAAVNSIDIPMALDYLLFTHVAEAWDSLTHNYYVYLDDQSKQWRIFPWDADESFTNGVKPIVFEEFKNYFSANSGNFNQLYLYLSNHLSDEDLKNAVKNFEAKFSKADLLSQVEKHQTQLKKYFDFDNALWNGKFIERKKSIMKTNEIIDALRERLK